MEHTKTETIGCDISDKKVDLCILRADGGLERPKAVEATRAAMRKFFGNRERAHVVIEVSTHSRWISELLKDLGHEVTVANPRRLRLITASDSKSDRTDAELLARLGRADRSLLAPIEHRGRATQADLAIARSRDVLVHCRTKLVNHARGLVKSFGERLPRCDAEYFHKKARAHVPKELQLALEPIFNALAQLSVEIKQHDRSIERVVSERYPDVTIVSQPRGVGELTGFVYLLTLEDKERFKKSRTVGAFIGLRPRQSQSGEVDKQLRITKAGDPFLRRLLVQSAQYTLGPFGGDSDLRRWGLELAKRGGKNAKKRAIIAVARKLAVLMHRLWVTGEVYEPIGYAA